MAKQGKQRRKKLTDSEEGLELLMLLKQVANDGRIDDHEVDSLSQWASHVEDSEVAAVRKLAAAVRSVCHDGMITEEEREFLFTTIASLLPEEDRNVARFRRRQAKASERNEAKELARLEKERVNGLETIDTYVAGVRHEGRESWIRANVRMGDQVRLQREKDNKFSETAIAVSSIDGTKIGYVADNDARWLAEYFDEPHLYVARVRTLHISRDGAMVPLLQGTIYPVGATQPDLLATTEVRPLRSPAAQALSMPANRSTLQQVLSSPEPLIRLPPGELDQSARQGQSRSLLKFLVISAALIVAFLLLARCVGSLR